MRTAGRPPGKTGRAAVLSAADIRKVLRLARARGDDGRAESVLILSLTMGLRANELALLRWVDAFDDHVRVRRALRLRPPVTRRTAGRDVAMTGSARQSLADYAERRGLHPAPAPEAALFPGRCGAFMNPASMTRFVNALYRDAGIFRASSRSGRRTLVATLAATGVDLRELEAAGSHDRPSSATDCP